MFRRLNRIVLQPHWLHFESESATLTPLAASQYRALKSEPATLFLADGGSLVYPFFAREKAESELRDGGFAFTYNPDR